MERLPRIVSGYGPLDDALEKYASAAERALNLTGVPPLVVEPGPAGNVVKLALPLTMWVKLTGGGTAGAYTATQVMPSASGAWSTFPSGWTGTAYEYNATATLPVTGAYVVEVRYHGQSNDWRFQSGSC